VLHLRRLTPFLRSPRRLGLLLFALLVTAGLSLVSTPTNAASVATTDFDSRCAITLVNSTTAYYNCYFDPAVHRSSGASTSTRPSAMFGTGGTGAYAAGNANFNSGAGQFMYLERLDAAGASVSNNTQSLTGFGAAAGLPVGAYSSRVVFTGGHGMTAGQSYRLRGRVGYWSGSCPSGGTLCGNIDTTKNVGGVVNVPVYTYSGSGNGYWPADWFPTGASAGPVYVPPSQCEALTPSLVLNGASITPGSVAVDTYTVSPQDTVTTAVRFTVGQVYNVLYRYGPANPFRATSQASAVLATDGSGTVLQTLNVTPYAVGALNKLELKCTGPDNISAYFSFDTGLWTQSPALNRACASLVLTMPEGTFDDGDNIKVGYQLPAPPLGGFVNADAWVDVYISIPAHKSPPLAVETRNLLGALIGGVVPFVGDVPIDSRGSITFLNITANAGFEPYLDRPLDTVKINCTDSLGKYQVEGTGPAVSFTATIGKSSDASCYDGSGMSLQPATWIRGFARMTTCLGRELIVPNPIELTESVDSFTETLGDRPPFVIIEVAIGFAQDIDDSYQSSSGTGCFAAPAIPGVTGAPTDMCIGDGVPVSSPQRSMIAMLLVVPMVIGMASQILALVRSRAEVLEDENGQTSWNF